MIRNASDQRECRVLAVEWHRQGAVAVIGEACGVMLGMAGAMGVVGEHTHGSQITSEQKWKGCRAPLRGHFQPVQKRSTRARWTASIGLSGFSPGRGHVRAVPAVEKVSAACIATARAAPKFVTF